jgi:ketosteroid isomerase-like protein
MTEADNKKLMQGIFTALSKGDDSLFLEAMADDMQWIWMGSGQWSKTFNGKKEVLGGLWRAVRETLKAPYKVIAENFIADGNYVVVEATGQNSTPDGKTYSNKYCWVCQIVDGKIAELKEYMDTDLVTKTFTEKPIALTGEKFLFDFGMAKAILHFITESEMQFTITEKEGKPFEETETVAINRTEIGPNLYVTTWKEKNQNTITQVQDFNKGIVYSNWTLPNGEFLTKQGAIIPVNKM